MSHYSFITLLDCMDGRTKKPIGIWLSGRKDIFPDANTVADLITDPGVDGILAGDDEKAIAAVKWKADISKEKHGSTTLLIAGHEDCAGNPVSKEKHYDHIRSALETVYSWGFSRIVGLYVDNVEHIEEDGNVKVVFDEIVR